MKGEWKLETKPEEKKQIKVKFGVGATFAVIAALIVVVDVIAIIIRSLP